MTTALNVQGVQGEGSSANLCDSIPLLSPESDLLKQYPEPSVLVRCVHDESGCRCDPTPIRWHSNQEHRMSTHWRNVNRERKLGVAVQAEIRGRCVNYHFGRSRRAPGIAYQCTDHRGHRTGGATGVSSVKNKSLNFEGALARDKVNSDAAALSRPRTRPAVYLTHRVVNPGGGDNAFHPTPTHDGVALGKSPGAQNQ